MKRSEVKKMIRDIIQIKTKQTQYHLYNKEFEKRFSEYSLDSSDQSIEFTYKFLKIFQDSYIYDSKVKELSGMIAKIFSGNLKNEDLNFIRERIAQFYVSKRPKEKYRKKDDYVGISFYKDFTNMQVGEMIGDGFTTWIKEEYTTDSEVSKYIISTLENGIKKGLTGGEISAILKNNLADFTPEKYGERFGEDKYWKGVAEQHISKSRTIADIYNYDEAGIQELRIYARMDERTCPICALKHRTTVAVSSAVKSADAYVKSSQAGSIEGMKDAFPWGSDSDLPTFHFLCQCYTEAVFPDEYVIEDEMKKIGNDKTTTLLEKVKLFGDAIKIHNKMKHESLIVYGKNGKGLAFRDGAKSRVMIDKGLSNKLKKEGSGLIHNHPGNSSLSLPDALVSKKYNIEVYAVADDVIYKLKVSDQIPDEILSFEFYSRFELGQSADSIWNELSKLMDGISYGTEKI